MEDIFLKESFRSHVRDICLICTERINLYHIYQRRVDLSKCVLILRVVKPSLWGNEKFATWTKKIIPLLLRENKPAPLLIGVRDIIRDGNLINARFLVQWLSAHCWSLIEGLVATCGYLCPHFQGIADENSKPISVTGALFIKFRKSPNFSLSKTSESVVDKHTYIIAPERIRRPWNSRFPKRNGK